MTAYRYEILSGKAYPGLVRVEIKTGRWCDVDGKRWVMLEGYALDNRGDWFDSEADALAAAADELDARAGTHLARARECREQAANQKEVANV